MAYYDDTDEDEQPNGASNTSAPSTSVNGSGTGQSTSAQSGTVDSGAPTAAAGTSTASGVGSSGGAPAPNGASKESFVNISQYLNANQPQSQKLAGQVAGDINQKASDVDNSLNSTVNSFDQAADAQKVTENSDLLNNVKNNAESVTADPNQTSAFGQQLGATYSGPNQLEDLNSGNDWATLQSQLQTAQNAKDESNSESGRMQLIKDVSNSPRQSQGALTFDNLLLQSNPNSAAQLQAAGSSLGSFADRETAADQAAQTYAQNVAAGNQTTATDAQTALTGGWQGLSDSLNQRLADKNTADSQSVSDLQTALANKTATEDQLTQLGIANPNNLSNVPNADLAQQSYYGVNPGSYITGNTDTDIYSVANQQDLARQAALQQLAGQSVILGSPVLSPIATLGQSGPAYNFNSGGFTSAIAGAQSQYQSALNQILSGASTDGNGNYDAATKQKIQQLQSQYGLSVPQGRGYPVTGQLSAPLGKAI